MRVLAGVTQADFDIPTETFTIELAPGAEAGPVLAAIEALGYTPERLDRAPVRQAPVARVDRPASEALRTALVDAKRRGVALVVAFGGPFCPLCREFEATVLADARVLERLAAFAFLKIDTERDPAAARDLGVHGVPAIRALDGDGRVIARRSGALTVEAFVELLRGLGASR